MKRTLGLLFFAWMLSVCIALPVHALNYNDSFSGTSIDSFWWTPSASGGNTVGVVGGELVMTQSAYDGKSGMTFNFNIVGDFTATVDYRLAVWPANNYERIGLGSSETGPVERSQDPGWFGEAYLTHFPDGVYALPPTTDTLGRLKLERLGNTVTGYYWNGSGWTAVHSYTNNSILDDTLIGFSIWNGYVNVPVTVAFDNFTLNAPGTPDPTATPEPITLLLLGASLAGLAGARRFGK